MKEVLTKKKTRSQVDSEIIIFHLDDNRFFFKVEKIYFFA